MSAHDELAPLLKKLRMSGILQTLELRSRQATDDNLSHGEFLYRVLSDEVERRDGKQLDQRLRRASFEHHKTLEDFDFLFNPTLPKTKIIDLATCSFLERHQNVLLIGPTGTGKSHIAQAMGQLLQPVHLGLPSGHRVLLSPRLRRRSVLRRWPRFQVPHQVPLPGSPLLHSDPRT